ncbi:MAG: Asp/Glu racemase [Rhodobacteraceae bacterium]|nr:Asp/Glu racemase [Paracoccaceae bacterium]
MKLSFDTDEGFGQRAKLGLIVLETDESLEPEINRIAALPGVGLYHTRIPMVADVTPETLMRMKQDLPATAATLPETMQFDVIGYGCTSASTVIGSDAVRDAIRQARPGVQVTDPLRATIAACQALNVQRLGFVTPYIPEVSARMRDRLQDAGIEVAGFGSFEEQDDRIVARISEASVLKAIETVAAQAPCDAVFVSCTNLRLLNAVEQAEAATGIPVFSSNLALAWHMLKLAGLDAEVTGPGRLLSLCSVSSFR